MVAILAGHSRRLGMLTGLCGASIGGCLMTLLNAGILFCLLPSHNMAAVWNDRQFALRLPVADGALLVLPLTLLISLLVR